MNTTDKNKIEWLILIALFKATIEQTSKLIGQPQREAKLFFNQFRMIGYKLLKKIEGKIDNNFLEDMSFTIENSINDLRAGKIIKQDEIFYK